MPRKKMGERKLADGLVQGSIKIGVQDGIHVICSCFGQTFFIPFQIIAGSPMAPYGTPKKGITSTLRAIKKGVLPHRFDTFAILMGTLSVLAGRHVRGSLQLGETWVSPPGFSSVLPGPAALTLQRNLLRQRSCRGKSLLHKISMYKNGSRCTKNMIL